MIVPPSDAIKYKSCIERVPWCANRRVVADFSYYDPRAASLFMAWKMFPEFRVFRRQVRCGHYAAARAWKMFPEFRVFRAGGHLGGLAGLMPGSLPRCAHLCW